MHRSLSRTEVRRVDEAAIARLGVPGLLLMENAGRQVADAVESLLADRASDGREDREVVVVAGGGNNGGDGFVCARHLLIRSRPCRTLLLAPEEKYTGDAGANLRFLRAAGGLIETAVVDHAVLSRWLSGASVIVDAIGGTGITGPLRPEMAAAVDACNASARPIVAVDIPTGLDCDSGEPTGASCIRAAVTVTFVARKRGFDNKSSIGYTGRVIVADIGVPASLADAAP